MKQQLANRLVHRGIELFDSPAVAPHFAGLDAADALIADLDGTPHAFVLACIADRQVKTEIAWRLPYELGQRLGGLSFAMLAGLKDHELRTAYLRPVPLHRYPERMATLALAAIRRIADVYGGNAARIWSGTPSSAEVVLRFLGFEGVGPKIATMATNILARDFKVPLADYYSVDVSVDVHLRRVFSRLGLTSPDASTEQIVYTARALHAAFPGLMDLTAWEIGRQWCRPTQPRCAECYMSDLCPSAGAV